jgi:hypothetical protein
MPLLVRYVASTSVTYHSAMSGGSLWKQFAITSQGKLA